MVSIHCRDIFADAIVCILPHNIEKVSSYMYTVISRKVVEKKHQSACDKTERWSGYSLEFCILA